MYAAATQEALVEQYNDQLRELREAGLSEQAEEVREALRALRDEERAPEASVQVQSLSDNAHTACAGMLLQRKDSQELSLVFPQPLWLKSPDVYNYWRILWSSGASMGASSTYHTLLSWEHQQL